MNLLADFHVEALLVLLALSTLVLSSVREIDAKLTGRWLSLGVLGLFVYSLLFQAPVVAEAGSAYRIDELGLIFRQLCLLVTAVVLSLAAEYASRSRFPAAEQYALMLLAATGMLVLCVARDFILLFVALELVTTASYVLVTFQRGEPGRIEASVKYLTMGALSTAFIAYGTAFVFGTTGSTAYDSVRAAFSATPGIEFTEGLGVAFVLAALAFKVAAAPGHMWAPDVYQGAPLPVTAFLATASKCAAFAALVRLCLDAFLPLQAQWGPALLVVAALTVVWGSFGAIRQTDLRRLLGYSSITHSGYLLFATVSGGAQAASAILFYLIQYVFSTLACFLVLGILARRGGDYSLEALKGLNRRSPWLSWMTAVALLSLTGIPPFSGFIAKYLVLASVPNYAEFASLYFVALGLVLIAVVVSVVYYFGIIRTMWLDSGVDAGVNEERIERDATLVAPLVACVAFVVLLGAYPSLALTPANDAAKSLGLETQRQPGTLAVQHTKSHMLLRPKINHTP